MVYIPTDIVVYVSTADEWVNLLLHLYETSCTIRVFQFPNEPALLVKEWQSLRAFLVKEWLSLRATPVGLLNLGEQIPI